MAITAFTSPVSGAWPFGIITVAAAGTAVPLNTNIGPQTATVSTRPTGTVQQIQFTAGGTNTGLIYILRKVQGQTVSKATPNFVVAIVWPGQTLPFPSGITHSFSMNPDDYVVDADTSGNTVMATGFFG